MDKIRGTDEMDITCPQNVSNISMCFFIQTIGYLFSIL